MFWATMSTVLCSLIFAVAVQYVQAGPKFWDNAVNATSIFMSYSINQDWYIWCECDRCSRRLECCVLGTRSAAIELEVAGDAGVSVADHGENVPRPLSLEMAMTQSSKVSVNEMDKGLPTAIDHMRHNSAMSVSQSNILSVGTRFHLKQTPSDQATRESTGNQPIPLREVASPLETVENADYANPLGTESEDMNPVQNQDVVSKVAEIRNVESELDCQSPHSAASTTASKHSYSTRL